MKETTRLAAQASSAQASSAQASSAQASSAQASVSVAGLSASAGEGGDNVWPKASWAYGRRLAGRLAEG